MQCNGTPIAVILTLTNDNQCSMRFSVFILFIIKVEQQTEP
jgi:hypothetical protein